MVGTSNLGTWVMASEKNTNFAGYEIFTAGYQSPSKKKAEKRFEDVNV